MFGLTTKNFKEGSIAYYQGEAWLVISPKRAAQLGVEIKHLKSSQRVILCKGQVIVVNTNGLSNVQPKSSGSKP